jgi:glutamate-ammonia-ligase adenylyltransferase
VPKPLSELSPWKQAIKAAPDPDRVRAFLNQLSATPDREHLVRATPETARILAALFSGSLPAATALIAHPGWLSLLSPESLRNPRRQQGLRDEVAAWLEPALKSRDCSGALARLREFQQRELIRLAARDLSRLANAIEITLELSNLADLCLSTVLRVCAQQQSDRLGSPYHLDANGQWVPTSFAVLGLGKLGGQELNYSSDVDLTFVYSEEGEVFKDPPRAAGSKQRGAAARAGLPGGNRLTNHQYFKRLAEAFVAEVIRSAPEGTLYRVDLRLRPEGDAGPWVRSLPSYESFYSQWGQTWERMMLIKARGVAGDSALAHEFLEMIQPFRFPRSLPEGALREVSAMKLRMENEVVKSGELDRNVKLGRGGIREIEFIVQSTQLVHGSRMPFLQGRQTLPTLEKMVQYNLIEPENARALTEAYCFLRDLEHRLQMENNLQTHTVPSALAARERLARLMGFSQLGEFEKAHRRHTARVRQLYARYLPDDETKIQSGLPARFEGHENEWKKILADHQFKNIDQSLRMVKEFTEGPGYVHVSNRTVALAGQLLPKLFQLCPSPRNAPGPRHKVLSDPDRVLARLDSFIAAYGARSVMFETWTSNPSLFALLLLLFDRSEFLAEMAIRTPDLVDELVLSGRLSRSKTAVEILEDLRHGFEDQDQRLWIRRYHQAEFMRIGLRDILGLSDAEQNLTELSALAEACLEYALQVVLRKHKIRTSPLVIIGLGKLGGQELNYGSDLDILFVADDREKNLPKLQRVAIDFIYLLSSPTETGVAFVTDARLRPDGEKGLLVNTIAAYEDYYRKRAQLWEIQALSRARPVAGNLQLGERFRTVARVLTNFRNENVKQGFPAPATADARSSSSPEGFAARATADSPSRTTADVPSSPSRATADGGSSPSPLNGERAGVRGATASRSVSELSADQGLPPSHKGSKKTASTKEPAKTGLTAYAPDWKQQIAHMRQRIEKERTPVGQADLSIKTGAGGLIDAEFIAQALSLENGWLEPNSLRALERARDDHRLPKRDAVKLIDNFRELRRIESILRRWSFEGEAVLPANPEPFYRVSIRCGFKTPDLFRQSVAASRKAIRDIYQKIFPLP